MKRTLSILTLAVFGMLGSMATSVAQPNFPQPDSVGIAAMVDSLTSKLDLSKEQKQGVSAAYFDFLQKVRETLAQEHGRRGAFRKIQAMAEDCDREAKQVLTEEQAAQYDKLVAAERARQRARLGEMRRRRR